MPSADVARLAESRVSNTGHTFFAARELPDGVEVLVRVSGRVFALAARTVDEVLEQVDGLGYILDCSILLAVNFNPTAEQVAAETERLRRHASSSCAEAGVELARAAVVRRTWVDHVAEIELADGRRFEAAGRWYDELCLAVDGALLELRNALGVPWVDEWRVPAATEELASAL